MMRNVVSYYGAILDFFERMTANRRYFFSKEFIHFVLTSYFMALQHGEYSGA